MAKIWSNFFLSGICKNCMDWQVGILGNIVASIVLVFVDEVKLRHAIQKSSSKFLESRFQKVDSIKYRHSTVPFLPGRSWALDLPEYFCMSFIF